MLANLLHLHGFKCAGTTFIWSLERASGGKVLYVESPSSGARLDWRLVEEHLREQAPLAVTSHLITLPPPGAVARLKVALLREPMARIASAYRFQTEVQDSLQPMPFAHYVEGLVRSTLSNYQTRHLSPQEAVDWQLRKGWAARPELIDLNREDLFVGLVERYDESMVALEHQLEQMGMPMDLAYPEAKNSTRPVSQNGNGDRPEGRPQAMFVTELDLSLYKRAERRLEERLLAVPALEQRLGAFQQRRQALAASPANIKLKPQAEWVCLPVADLRGGELVNQPG
ncbi:hypothetical protein KQ304_05355 [Synechococcus sp. CS-1329]|uniref:hypothetical protein n=1 Tax=Synechococcus sp. CS-1329 TaxID=2847975 RepID=UPI00223B611A|nr:hypothetical protein [Synechococcus sp. CS-1329]MCT0218434.1 hypothetical protein [Synechococcus sp. CS-1329]